MSSDRDRLEAAIAVLEAQRAVLGDAVTDLAIAPLKARLLELPHAHGSHPAVVQTLRQATILFLDIVGSTSLARNLDPEETYRVLDGALARYTSIVLSHGGKVLQYSGDNLLAVFGADRAHEDDPERAVRTGLDLLAAERSLRDDQTMPERLSPFEVRIGIHTGAVLLGGGVDAERSVRGLAVHIAARMEQTAPAGGLRISHDTYRHVRGVFDVEVQPPMQVKGLDEPIVTYLVLRAKPRAFRVATRGIEGVETRMVGRGGELAALQDAFKALFVERKLLAITIVGEPGLGKSRLLYEFENWAEARAEQYYFFQGRTTPQTQFQPYGLLRDIIAWRLQLSDKDSMQAAKEKIEAEIIPLFLAEDGADIAEAHAHLLGQLIGLDYAESRHVEGILEDARQIRNRGFHAAALLFRRLSAKGQVPIVLNLEDLHWADDASLDFLHYLTEVDRDVPILILGLTRPTLFERREAWWGTEGFHRRLDLKPLGRRDSHEFANELLKKLPGAPAALRELVIGSAEGNPFYMEELVKMLVDQGAIDTGGEHWTLYPEKLLATQVPAALTGVLQARLDGLPAMEKRILQAASVIGMTFWDDALVTLDPSARQALPMLVQRDLVVPREGARLEDVHEYAFKHQILHHVVYDTLLKAQRRALHAKTAQWLVGLTGPRAADFLGDTAEHYEKAEDRQNACEFFLRAAEHAKARYAHGTALDYAQRALVLMEEGSAHDQLVRAWRLRDVRERTLQTLGRRPEQRAELDALEAIAQALNDDLRRAELRIRQSILGMRMADWSVQEHAAREAMMLAEKVQNPEVKLDAKRLLASALTDQGDITMGESLALEGLQEARALGLRRAEGLMLNTLTIVAFMRGDLAAGLEWNQQSLRISRESNDRQGEAIDLANCGGTWLDLGNFSEAASDLEEALRLARVVGARQAESSILSNLSRLAWQQGHNAQARAHALAALEIARAMQAKDGEVLYLWNLGTAELGLDHFAEALETFSESLTLAQSIESAWQLDATAGLARTALAMGDHANALSHVETLLAHFDAGGTVGGTEAPRLVHLTCYQVLEAAGDARARAILEKAKDELLARAATITDASLRQSFLHNITEHREILAIWTAKMPG